MNKKERADEHDREYLVEEEKPIDFHDLLGKFIRRKNLFIYFALPIFLGIIISQIRKPYNPIYQATFDLGVSREKPVEGFFSTYRDYQTGTVTQRVISNLLSVNLAEKVIDTLGLYYHVENGNPHFKIEINVKNDFTNPLGPFKLKFNDNEISLFSEKGEKIKEGELDNIIDLGVLEFKIIPLKEIPEGKTYIVTFYPKKIMALGLRNSLSIENLDIDKIEKGIGSSGTSFTGEGVSKKLVTSDERYYYPSHPGILRISVYWGDPENALKIANVLSEQIIKEDKKEKSQRFIQSRTFIDSQLVLYQAKLIEHAEKIREFKKKKKIADLDASTQLLVSQISQIELRKSQLEFEKKVLKNINENLLETDNEGSDTTFHLAVTLLPDPILQNFYSQLLKVAAELKGKLKEYSPGHPKVLEIKAKLGGLKGQMKEEIGKKMQTIKAEIQNVENQIRTLLVKLENVSEDEVELATLERDRETAEKLYTFFIEKLEETRVQEVGVTSDLKIINPPVVTSGPVNSKGGTFKSLAIALVISIMAGGFAVFIVEYLDNSIKDPDMVSKKTGLPIFASIPIIEDEKSKMKKVKSVKTLNFVEQVRQRQISLAIKAKDILKKRKRTKKLRILNEDISSAEFEAFRKLSMNLEFAHPEKNYQVIYITSVGPEEGKTFISANLGHVLGMANKKVVIIDTDFRKKRGNLTYMTKSKDKKGLFDVLGGKAKLQDTIVPFTTPLSEGKPSGSATNSQDALRPTPDVQNNALRSLPYAVDILPTGKIPPNPFIFLESEMMKKIITELKSKYDYVLIDGVPLLLFSDAAYLANFADGVLLTIKYGKTGFKELESSRDILLASRSNIIGIVMNFVTKTLGSYYYHYYHKYYSKYYKKE